MTNFTDSFPQLISHVSNVFLIKPIPVDKLDVIKDVHAIQADEFIKDNLRPEFYMCTSDEIWEMLMTTVHKIEQILQLEFEPC